MAFDSNRFNYQNIVEESPTIGLSTCPRLTKDFNCARLEIDFAGIPTYRDSLQGNERERERAVDHIRRDTIWGGPMAMQNIKKTHE